MFCGTYPTASAMSAASRSSCDGVGDGHRLAGQRHQPGDAVPERHPELLDLLGLLAERDLEDEVLLLAVDQEQRGGVGADDVGGGGDDHVEQAARG